MEFFAEHIRDLSEASENRGIFTFSHFLTLDEQSVLLSMSHSLCPFSLFGGAEGCERVIARFGSPQELGWEEPFPIACVGITPKNERFADELSHRDVLGAVMSLGLEREQTGDIAVVGKHAFVFVNAGKADYICSELTKIKHTDVRCEITEFDAEEPLYKTEACSVIASSDRLDCVACAVYDLSRSAALPLFEGGRVFINGRVCQSPSAHAKIGDIVSVRGRGRFRFLGETARTKKGRLVLLIEKFV